MKKIIIIFSLIFVASPVMAMTPGYGANIQCRVWREGDVIIGGKTYCGDTQDMFRRLYDLEVAFTKLESQYNQLQSTCNNQSVVQVAPSDNSIISSLENRVSKIESTLNFIQTTVVQAFSTTIGLLQKLITKQ